MQQGFQFRFFWYQRLCTRLHWSLKTGTKAPGLSHWSHFPHHSWHRHWFLPPCLPPPHAHTRSAVKFYPTSCTVLESTSSSHAIATPLVHASIFVPNHGSSFSILCTFSMVRRYLGYKVQDLNMAQTTSMIWFQLLPQLCFSPTPSVLVTRWSFFCFLCF